MAEGKVSRFVRALLNGGSSQFKGEVYGHEVTYTINNSDGGSQFANPAKMSPAAMWRTQPHLRTVVDFQARQIGLLGLHLFDRITDDEVKRVRVGKVYDTIKRPNPEQTTSEFVEELVSEWALYNETYVIVLPNITGGYDLRVLPADWVTATWKNSFQVEYYVITGFDEKEIKVKPEQILHFKGWTAGDPQKGTSPVETLRLILAEQHSARVYRDQVWRKGGRNAGVITRPADAPPWNNPARAKFMRMWTAFTGNSGERAGEDVLLEDGMKYERVALNARDEQFVEASKLSLETVCQVYHINPTMVGMLDNANYSNVREFRRGLYGDTLGPIIKKIEDRFNTFLLPLLGAGTNMYVEFNVEAMLKGSFEEQAGVVNTSTGRPWQTVDEARKLFNLPPLPGGDKLVMPLNLVAVGEDDGNDVTTEMGADELVARGNYAATLIRSGFDPNESMQAAGLPAVPHLGLLPVTVQRPTDGGAEGTVDQALVDEITKSPEEVFTKFLERQASAVLSRKKAGREDWWDEDRWMRELFDDLVKSGVDQPNAMATSVIAVSEAFALYNEGREDVKESLVNNLLPWLHQNEITTGETDA